MYSFCTFFFSAQSLNFHYIYGCYESDDVRVDVVVDDDVVAYADFNKKEVVWVLPHLPQPAKDIQKMAYELAKASIAHCHSVLGKAKDADPGAPLRQGTDLGTLHCEHSFSSAWSRGRKNTVDPTESRCNQKELREHIPGLKYLFSVTYLHKLLWN